MRSFLIVWLLAFSLIGVGAAAVSWFVGRYVPPPSAAVRPAVRTDNTDPAASGPFTEADAVDIVSRRLPRGSAGERFRRELQRSATVTYHSAQHWRVCYDDACWVAHGPGRYAEPDNDAARQREARSTTPR